MSELNIRKRLFFPEEFVRPYHSGNISSSDFFPSNQETLEENLKFFYSRHNTEKIKDVKTIVRAYFQKQSELNFLLRATYGEDLSSLNAPNEQCVKTQKSCCLVRQEVILSCCPGSAIEDITKCSSFENTAFAKKKII